MGGRCMLRNCVSDSSSLYVNTCSALNNNVISVWLPWYTINLYGWFAKYTVGAKSSRLRSVYEKVGPITH